MNQYVYRRPFDYAARRLSIPPLLQAALAPAGADRYWVNDDADGLRNKANNWSATDGGTGGAGVPGSGDAAIFTSSEVTACTCDVAISVASIEVQAGYSGKLDFADSAYSHVIAGDATFDGSGETDLGNATITIGGDFDYTDQATWDAGTSSVVMTGTGSVLIAGGGSKTLYALTISGTITLSSLTAGYLSITSSLTVSSTFTLNDTVYLQAGVSFSGAGTLNGGGTFNILAGCDGSGFTGALNNISGGITPPYTAGPFTTDSSTTMYVNLDAGGAQDLVFNAGTYSLNGTWWIYGTVSNHLSVKPANGIDLHFLGSITLNTYVTWVPGTGTITLSGSSNQSINFNGEAVEDIDVNKSAGTVTLTGALVSDSLTVTGTTGNFDAATFDVTLTGVATLDGATVSAGSGAWDVGGNCTIQCTTFNEETATWSVAGNLQTSTTGTYNKSGGVFTMTTAGKTLATGTKAPYKIVMLTGGYIYATVICETANLYVQSGGVDTTTTLRVYDELHISGEAGIAGTGGDLIAARLYNEGGFCNLPVKVGKSTESTIEPELDAEFGDFSQPVQITPVDSGAAATFTCTLTNHFECQSDFDLIGNAESGAIELDMAGFDLTVAGDILVADATTTVTWTKGIGTITLNGSSDQSIDFDGKSVEDIIVNKTAGNVTMTGAVTTDSLTGTSTGTGDFDPNGQTITITNNCDWAAAFTFDGIGVDVMNGCDWQIGGNFTADGQTLPATALWDLDVTGTAVASGAGDVEYSTAGVTEITATTWNDGLNNTNWDFGGTTGPFPWYLSRNMTGNMQGLTGGIGA